MLRFRATVLPHLFFRKQPTWLPSPYYFSLSTLPPPLLAANAGVITDGRYWRGWVTWNVLLTRLSLTSILPSLSLSTSHLILGDLGQVNHRLPGIFHSLYINLKHTQRSLIHSQISLLQIKKSRLHLVFIIYTIHSFFVFSPFTISYILYHTHHYLSLCSCYSTLLLTPLLLRWGCISHQAILILTNLGNTCLVFTSPPCLISMPFNHPCHPFFLT